MHKAAGQLDPIGFRNASHECFNLSCIFSLGLQPWVLQTPPINSHVVIVESWDYVEFVVLYQVVTFAIYVVIRDVGHRVGVTDIPDGF